jgi:hypothetical protein
MGWTPGQLFDVAAGLVWRLAGEHVEKVQSDRVRVTRGRTIMRRMLGNDLRRSYSE